MTVTIHNGDCREILATLPDKSVRCVVTSSPYWGLRDYGVDGQLGMERSLGEFIDVMIEVFRQIRRVLRDDGTLWLNLGDSYATSPNGRSAADVKLLGNDDRTFRDKPFSTIGPVFVKHGGQISGNRIGQSRNKDSPYSDFGGRVVAGDYIKPKDLCGIPWRLAFGLQADGWWLRQDIIWSKPNPMPESVTDRCTKAHEYIFLLSKSARYYYDADAIAEPFADERMGNPGAYLKKGNSKAKGYLALRQDAGMLANGGGWNESGKVTTRNKRSVWEVATAPFSEAHFATFPPALIEPCILAGCPKGGTVLDPFGGAGTTGLVADRLGRNAILIELNAEYAAMAERRIRGDAPLFVEVCASA